ncbi:11805_t:CDS:1, partial [Racocetra persica]
MPPRRYRTRNYSNERILYLQKKKREEEIDMLKWYRKAVNEQANTSKQHTEKSDKKLELVQANKDQKLKLVQTNENQKLELVQTNEIKHQKDECLDN